jgi:RNA processing factor Prp31
MTNSNTFLSNI